MHGPSRVQNPHSLCMKNGRCSKKFPKPFSEEIPMSEDKYAVYRRPRRPRGFFYHKGKVWNNATVNQWVVPYNPFLSQKYSCQVCATNKAIKCIYKTLHISGRDLQSHLYASLTSFDSLCGKPSNSPGGYEYGGISWCGFNNTALQHHSQRKQIKTDRGFSYELDVLMQPRNRKPYKKYVASIGRTVHVSPQDPDTSTFDFYFVIVVLLSRSKISGESVVLCLINCASPLQLCWSIRYLPVLISFGESKCPTILSEKDAAENIHREVEVRVPMAEYKTLKYVAHYLISTGKTLDAHGLPDLNTYSDVSAEVGVPATKSIVQQELNAYSQIGLEHVTELDDQFNPNQRDIFDQVVRALASGGRRKVFLGGTRKSFLLEQIFAQVRSQRKIAIAVASSGIAATWLTGGHTAHSTVCISLKLTEHSTCSLSWQSQKVELIRNASLIISDEAPMMNCSCFKAVDRTFRYMMKNESEPFGGKVIVLVEPTDDFYL
ncbi:Helitron helicase [Phytophthora megakarya]|uniref:ATP-dependent DNA helicase n=1 Tax=Phytophthora megakarya TaxID=4795 RepID=A0A225UWN4_9STRA|nr:Helitron helicase [Phytophthora megakarya]